MIDARTKPNRLYNRRLRRLEAHFGSSLRAKEHRCEREEAFQDRYAPMYRDFGRRVEDADRAREIREADMHRYVGGGEVTIRDGRVIVSRRGDA